ncbi:MAG: MdtA/MuxA family multidrug efflux RND transporter periplasmic adaptor subunit [Pigmentiphaga sp.]
MPRAPSPRRRRQLLLVLLFLAFAGAAAYTWHQLNRPPAAAPLSPYAGPVPVTVAKAARRTLPVQLDAVGTVTPLSEVTVRSRVDGELVEVAFNEGQRVAAGDLLARIDPRSYEIALAQAEGQQRQTVAQLRNARADLERYRTLHRQDSIARQQLDSQEALVRQYEGQQQSHQAAVDEARLRLDYTRITAPTRGRVGLRRVDEGNFVQAGDAEGLVVITQTQPISVLFSVPETRLTDILAALRAGQALQAEAWGREQRHRIATGTVRTFDNQIDPATGTLRLRAEFVNDDEALFPNQFVNIRLLVRELDAAVVIPLDAVQYGARGTYVYIVDDTGRARPRTIMLGTASDGWVAVTEGLDGGERVVLEGLDRLRDGREVTVVDTVPPAAT